MEGFFCLLPTVDRFISADVDNECLCRLERFSLVCRKGLVLVLVLVLLRPLVG